MPVARIVRGIGRVLITAGLVLLLFVAYQLWGTGLAEARAQDDLREEFAASLATTTTTTTTTPPTTGAPATGAPTSSAPTTVAPTTAPPTTSPPRAPSGAAVAILRIPRIDLDKAVVEGVSVDDLQKGPGHYPATPLPGEPGNAGIAGHRTTYGAPFGDLGELVEGDEMLVTTRAGEFRYVVDRIRVVSPGQVEVLDPTEEARLTLTTCHPKYTARQRLVVSGVLVGPASADPAASGDVGGETPAAGADGAGTPEGAETGADDGAPAVDDADGDGTIAGGDEEGAAGDEAGAGGDEEGTAGGEDVDLVALDDPSLAGDPSARGPAATWAAVTAAIGLAAWALGRRWRRWPSYVLALPLGTVALFQCFEQVARLLPANI